MKKCYGIKDNNNIQDKNKKKLKGTIVKRSKNAKNKNTERKTTIKSIEID